VNEFAQFSTRGASQSIKIYVIPHNVSVNVLFYNSYIFPDQGLAYQIKIGGQYDLYIFFIVFKALHLKLRNRQIWFNMLLFTNVFYYELIDF